MIDSFVNEPLIIFYVTHISLHTGSIRRIFTTYHQLIHRVVKSCILYNKVVKKGWDFREILKSKPRNLPVQLCQSKSSPECLHNFIQTREYQTMCLHCLEYNDLLEAHPMLNYDNPEYEPDDTFY